MTTKGLKSKAFYSLVDSSGSELVGPYESKGEVKRRASQLRQTGRIKKQKLYWASPEPGWGGGSNWFTAAQVREFSVKNRGKRNPAASASEAYTERAARRNPSDAYRAGVSAMKSAAARHGTTNLTPSIAQREEWRHAWGDFMKGWKAEAKRPNPASQASEAYTDFHGRPSEEVVTVKTEVHYHKHLAACGELRKLVIKPVGKLFTVSLSGFKKALLAFNEKRTQLFIEGGDQAVDLRQFGIKAPHETETLGEVRVIEYFTIKDHLGNEGGKAVYVHKFHKPYPVLIYNVLDQQLTFSGGSYKVLAEGIDK